MEQNENLEQRASGPVFGWVPVPGKPGCYVGGGPFTSEIYATPWFSEFAEKESATYSLFEYFRVCVRQAGGFKQLILNEIAYLVDAFRRTRDGYLDD